MPETFHSWFRIRTTCYFGLVPSVEDRSTCGRHQKKKYVHTFGTQGKWMTRTFIELYVYITTVPSGKNLLILSVGSNRIVFPGFAWANILILKDKNFFGISHCTLLSSQNEVALEDPWLSLVHLKTITQGRLPADISESTKFLATEFFSPQNEWMITFFMHGEKHQSDIEN